MAISTDVGLAAARLPPAVGRLTCFRAAACPQLPVQVGWNDYDALFTPLKELLNLSSARDCILRHFPKHRRKRWGFTVRTTVVRRLLHKAAAHVRTHLVERGGSRISHPRRVAELLRPMIGRKEIWRSLGTDSPALAKRRALRVAVQIEHEFEVARSKAGLNVDPIVLDGLPERKPTAKPHCECGSASLLTPP